VESSFRSLDYRVTSELSMQVHDVYSDVSGGEVRRLSRSFGSLTLTSVHWLATRSAPAGEVTEAVGTSPLEGRTVLFERGADGFRARFEEEPRDPALARGLEADLDFTGFLPRVPVEVSDRWKVDPATLATLFSPGGELGFRTAGGPAPALPSLGGRPGEGPKGEVEARLAEVDESGGQRIARIEISLALAWTRDLEDTSPFAPSFPPPASLELETAEVVHSFSGSGRLEWNLDARVLEGFFVDGEASVTVRQEGRLRTGEESRVWKQRIGLRGPRVLSVRSGKD